MPLHPGDMSVAVADMEIIVIIKVTPYPMLNSVARTADQNPIWLTDLGMTLTEVTESCLLPILKRA
jgi:hypothetical protein